MQTIELFSGTKSFSKVAQKLGHKTLTIDNDYKLQADLIADINNLDVDTLPKPDIVWASPPCQGFSVAVIGRNWNYDRTPKTKSAENAMALVKKTLEIIDRLKPKYWFIENPRGMLRKMTWLSEWVSKNGGCQHTIAYCQYGDKRQKPTDIWTNCKGWKPRPMCKPGSSCHESAPRGSRTGTQGLKGAVERGAIPEQVFLEIFKSIK